MKYLTLLISLVLFINAEELKKLNLNPLNELEREIIINKATERAFSGKYYKHKENGTYLCKQCNAPLYKSSAKFESGSGWPSFDNEIQEAITRVKDVDGKRTEILCSNCQAHLGHVFMGEGFTKTNTRHCVNSLSLNFEKTTPIKKAYFAGGCFWGVEHYFEDTKGVLSVVSGYMGGTLKNPTYKDVLKGNSGHLELVEITYDSTKVNYETLARLFFEIHDPTQIDGQGPDIGTQYLSAVFVSNKNEKKVIQKLITLLEDKNYNIATKILPKSSFYKAESYHQDYYKRTGKYPYCHSYIKRF